MNDQLNNNVDNDGWEMIIIQDLLKNTEDDHSDYEAVKECLQSIKEVANFINEEKRMLENMQVLTELQLSLYDPQNTMVILIFNLFSR